MTTWRLTLAWNGAAYVGWQRQAKGRSIQAVVEDALSRALGGEGVRVNASGRTDAGVHTLGQIVGFTAETHRSPEAMVAALNQHLPPDIAALDAAPMPPDFRPRRWVRRKLYRYRVLNRAARCPFRDGFVWHWRQALDLDAMVAAAPALEGRHDYTSFRAQGCGALHPVRTIEQVQVRRDGDEVHLDFVGNGFLRHQVRIMSGTLLEIGAGRRPPGELREILEARDRARAGRTAPAHGLWLMQVELGDGPRHASGRAEAPGPGVDEEADETGEE